MPKYLVIVESPAKAKTIEKFLGSNYKVVASMGHVRDLPKSTLGIDLKNDYEPKYITIRGKGELLKNLRKNVKNSEKVYLATDPDREGEAISWHLIKALNLENKEYKRISFNEITKEAVKNAIKNPRDIDMNLVDAQQARRVLDRVVGYSISPLLWKKVKRGLSAGRVQSAVLKIINDREKKIDEFIPEEYWTLDVKLLAKGIKKSLSFKFYGNTKGKIAIKSQKELKDIVNKIENSKFKISDIKEGNKKRKPPLPFTTSTMQQEAAKSLNFSTKKTMRVAQQLYEGVEIEGRGQIGLITYLRTDSTRISYEADLQAKNYIEKQYGERYLENTNKKDTTSKRIQDAHEAIRPAYVELSPVQVEKSLTKEQFKLYSLIWKRFIASRMKSAEYKITTVKIEANAYIFTGTNSKVTFKGFLDVYDDGEIKEEKNTSIEKLNKDTELYFEKFDASQHFTEAPAHFTEATLVKNLEELGIGRPSTYAPTITTIMARYYVTKEKKSLFITELGSIVNNIVEKGFPEIVDTSFTATMEELLDSVEDGDINWKTIIRNFYPDLEREVEKENLELEKVEIEEKKTGELCPICNRSLLIKYGKHGKFVACSGFPECKFTKPLLEKIGVKCPQCGGDIVLRKSKKGRTFYSCEQIDSCDFMSWQKPSDRKCPNCGSYMIEKSKDLVCSNKECQKVVRKQDFN